MKAKINLLFFTKETINFNKLFGHIDLNLFAIIEINEVLLLKQFINVDTCYVLLLDLDSILLKDLKNIKKIMKEHPFLGVILLYEKDKIDYTKLNQISHYGVFELNSDIKLLIHLIINANNRIKNLTPKRKIINNNTAEYLPDNVIDNENKFKLIFDSISNIAVQGYTSEGKVFYWNDASEEVYGYTKEEALGKSLFDLIVPEEQKYNVKNAIKYMLDNNCSIPAEYLILKRKDRSEVHLFSSHVVVNQKNANKELYCFDIDITTQKKIEFELESTKELYYSMIKTLPDGLIILDSKGKIIFGSDKCLDIFKVKNLSDIIGKSALEFVVQEDRASSYLHFSSLKEMIKKKFIQRILRSDKQFFYGEVTASLIKNTNNQENNFVLIIRDISDRVKTENNIKNLLSEKMMLLKEVHHRIKNNMNTISGLLYLQAESSEEDSTKRALHDARNRINSMMIIYDKLYRTEDFKYIEVSEYLNKLIDEIVLIFPHYQKVELIKNINLDKLEGNALFPIGIILTELITNSFKYAFEGINNPKLEIGISRKNEDHILLSVIDNGIGIPDSVLIKNTDTFGLTLVSLLTTQYHGTFDVEKDNGTSFIICLKM